MSTLGHTLDTAAALKPGAVVAAWDGSGEPRVLASGFADIEKSTPLAPDAIFRIASLTKPITALALMILLEERDIALDAPVAQWLPELAAPRVLRRLDAALDETVPARREITIEDLLTSRLGTGIVPAAPGSTPIQREIERQALVGFGPPDPAASIGPDQWIARLGALPLLAHPGERWFYSVASNVQGVLVARLAGMPLSEVFAERIFDPLGMTDTGFHLPPAKRDRLTPAYSANLELTDPPQTSAWSAPPAFEAGDGGLVSTARDYMAFVKMLHGQQRLLGEDWMALMFADHLDAAQREDAAYILDGRGWGYGLSVDPGRPVSRALSGTIGWAGGLGTSWSSDLDKNRAIVVLCPRALDDPAVYADHQALHRAAMLF